MPHTQRHRLSPLSALCTALVLVPAMSLASENSPTPLALEHWNIVEPSFEDAPSGADIPHASPASYPLAEDLHQRRELVIRSLAQEDLARWRRGYFAGGDPGKYLPGAAMAKLLVDPDDAMAHEYMNDRRSPAEHYHFAAVNWGRFFPLFGSILSSDTIRVFNERGGRYSDYITGGGTENHKTMQYTGPLVLPWYTDSGLGNLDRDATLAAGKKWVRNYVKNLYAVGMGEWESSTYHAFTINAFLNVYDFSKDPEVRLLAQAALDYYVGAYALKYTDGILSGPSQRGFSRGSAQAISDTLGWMWWGSSRVLGPADVRNFRYSSHTWTSRWRPNQVLTNIALRNLPELPAKWRNSKSNYWFGQRIEPRGNHFHESYFVSPHFSLGSLWAGWDRHGQTVRWQLTASGQAHTDGAITLTGGHPVMGRTFDGLGRYEQTAQADSTLILMADIPEDDEYPYTFVHIPEHATWPEGHGSWWIMRANDTWIAVHPLGEGAQLGFSARSSREQQRGTHPSPIIHIPGRRSGFIIQVSDRSQHESLADFQAALDASAVSITDGDDWTVQVRTLHGRHLVATQQAEQRYLAATIDGSAVTFSDWPVFEGPYLQQADGILRVWDGEQGYSVDFSGDLPVYADWSPQP